VRSAAGESYRGMRDLSDVAIDRPMRTGGASCQKGSRLDAKGVWEWLDIIADREHIGNANKPSMLRGGSLWAKMMVREVRHE
jgi:hypothetical protein